MAEAYNFALNEFVDVEAGFLIVKTFALLYRDHREKYPPYLEVYALPRSDREPEQSPVQYRGLDRDALDAYADSDLDAEVQLALLALENRAVNGVVFSQQDAEEAFLLLGPLQTDYEIIWSRISDSRALPPDGFSPVGFEPTEFPGDPFSASCDCMLFPRWHGTDEEGELFMPYFRQLNSHGMFATAATAQAFLDYYLSFDWTERGDFLIAEIFVRQ